MTSWPCLRLGIWNWRLRTRRSNRPMSNWKRIVHSLMILLRTIPNSRVIIISYSISWMRGTCSLKIWKWRIKSWSSRLSGRSTIQMTILLYSMMIAMKAVVVIMDLIMMRHLLVSLLKLILNNQPLMTSWRSLMKIGRTLSQMLFCFKKLKILQLIENCYKPSLIKLHQLFKKLIRGLQNLTMRTSCSNTSKKILTNSYKRRMTISCKRILRSKTWRLLWINMQLRIRTCRWKWTL